MESGCGLATGKEIGLPRTLWDSTKRNLQVDQPTVLVISDDVEFSRSITARWQMERHVPTFTMLSGDLWPRSIDNFAVAIVGPLRRELLSVFLCNENWLNVLVPAAGEAVLRARAETRARVAEEACATLDRQAMLGRYMLEMRHGLNNALTSLLGNSDLLLIEPGSLSAQARAQIETIRNMTLRIHEVLQRFSSIEKEMNVVAQQVERDSGKYRVAATAGD